MSHVRAFTAFDEWLRPWINLSVTKSLCLLVTSGRYCLSCHRPTPQPLSDWRLRTQSYGRGSNIWNWPLPWESLLRKETSRHSCSGLAMQVYPYQLIYLPARSSSPMRYSAPSKISSVSSWPLVRHQGTVLLLAVRNSDVDDLNRQASARITGVASRTYLSSDSNAYADDAAGGANTDEEFRHSLPIEYLNRLNLPSMPPHRLTLKVGQPVMLLRNIDISDGLCNGRRLIVSDLRTTWSFAGGKDHSSLSYSVDIDSRRWIEETRYLS